MTKPFTQPEGASPITEEQKEGLLQRWVSTQNELNQIEKNNILLGQQWLFNNRQKKADFAAYTFLSKLHKKMFNDVYSWAGNKRTLEATIGIDPLLIRENVASLRLDVQTWMANKTYPPEEIAVRYHHVLVRIHPFPNGNGRLCRLIADYINEQIYNNEPFSWGRDELYTNGTARSAYLQAIYEANNHRIESLVTFAMGK